MQAILSIASSESAGLAGLAVDLRTAAALGVHAAMAVAAVSVQPTRQPARLSPIAGEALREQIQIARQRVQPRAIKIGLLPADASSVVVAALRDFDGPIVIDPVATNGTGPLLAPADWLRGQRELLQLKPVLTPNLPELAALSERQLESADDAELLQACGPLLAAGASAVLVKGGHRHADADDVLVQASAVRRYPAERLAGEFRGTGCALSAAIAAQLARGRELGEAVLQAREFLRGAMLDALTLADGSRLPHLFFEYYGREGLP